jgi:hypothetical protein
MTLHDIVGSFILAGFVILGILGINLFMGERWVESRTNLDAQQNIVQLAQLMQHDFNKIGLADTTGKPITVAHSNKLSFWGDVNTDGVADFVTYYTGTPAELSSTPNPRDFNLYRVVAPSETLRVASGLSSFQFSFFDSTGGATSDSTKVRAFKVILTVESTRPFKDTLYSSARWEQIFYPRSLIK